MINFIHGFTHPYQTTTIDTTSYSDKLLLKNNINKVSNISEGISSSKVCRAVVALTGISLLGTAVAAFSSWFASSTTGLTAAAGTMRHPESELINNAISSNASFRNPAWDQLDNMTTMEINVVTSKGEMFSDNLKIEPHSIFAVATSFRDSVREILFNNYMKLKVTAGPGGIKSYFFHSLKMAISKGEKITTSFNNLMMENARSNVFSPQNIDAMRKIVHRLTDEIQHLKRYKDDIANRMKKRSDFGPHTARKWHAYFQSSFKKIDEMINALLEFKH
ncbi:hypothetical protein [Pantoea sp. App145]|uniref:hypothetical protein n=1 Tax=Pantoea sp. App145 TaxID=3071567 RepID=UPI003A80D354